MAIIRRIACFRRLQKITLLASVIMFMYIIIYSPEDLILPWYIKMKTDAGAGKIPIFKPTSFKKIDWHDFVTMEEEAKRRGNGEQGQPATLPDMYSRFRELQLYQGSGFNAAISNYIALNRSLPDIRHSMCLTKTYIESLPAISVVVPFYNEAISTLMRTVHSVLKRTPPHLVTEIILVDDGSDRAPLKENLEAIVSNTTKLKLLRIAQRSGLIVARLVGAREAVSDVLVFLDSHTEVNVNWLPPLLEPIALNYRVVTCPLIDVISHDYFEYRAQDEGARGAFDWTFDYRRLPMLPQDNLNMPEPFASPVMAGGLFAISRAFFWELGGYDPELDIWGGEQYEISFKIWQCGGKLLDTPCSRIGHVYRKFSPFPNPNRGNFLARNYRRVAEVWMDEYAQYLYDHSNGRLEIDPGDLTEQRAVRTRLQCKPFKWFMTQVAFDILDYYPPVEPKPYAYGNVRSDAYPNKCVVFDNSWRNVGIGDCKESAAEQKFYFGFHKDIRRGRKCWDVSEHENGSPIEIFSCHDAGGNQYWKYILETKQLLHYSNYCMEYDLPKENLIMNTCDDVKKTQKWHFEHVNYERMKEIDKVVPRVTGPIEPWPDDGDIVMT